MSFNPNRAIADAQECDQRLADVETCILCGQTPCTAACPSPGTFDPTPVINALGRSDEDDAESKPEPRRYADYTQEMRWPIPIRPLDRNSLAAQWIMQFDSYREYTAAAGELLLTGKLADGMRSFRVEYNDRDLGVPLTGTFTIDFHDESVVSGDFVATLT